MRRILADAVRYTDNKKRLSRKKDFEKAMEYLKSSAGHGNKYAEQLYQNAYSNRNRAAGMGAFRLFRHLARLIQNRIDDEKKGKFSLADRKLRRMINEKKEAQGFKVESHLRLF